MLIEFFKYSSYSDPYIAGFRIFPTLENGVYELLKTLQSTKSPAVADTSDYSDCPDVCGWCFIVEKRSRNSADARPNIELDIFRGNKRADIHEK